MYTFNMVNTHDTHPSFPSWYSFKFVKLTSWFVVAKLENLQVVTLEKFKLRSPTYLKPGL